MTTEKDDISIVHLREGASKLQHRDWGKGWKNIHVDNWHMRHFVVLVQRNEAVGIASYVDESFAAPGYLGVAAVEIRPDYRNRGLSKQLVQALINVASTQQKGLRVGYFEPMGVERLRHQFLEMGQAANIPLQLG